MPKSATRPVPTFDHLRKKAPMERTVRVVLEDAAAIAHQEATEALTAAETALRAVETQTRQRQLVSAEDIAAVDAAKAERDEAKDRLAEARAALKNATVTLRFRALGRKRYDDLVRAHPPVDGVDDDGNVVKSRDPYNYETFAPALVAASCVEPTMTAEEAGELFEEWNTAEVMELWVAALAVNTQRRVADFANFSNGTRG